MSKIDQGVLIFNEWFESARGLSGLEFKKLFLAMYDYQVHGKVPPSFTEKGETLAAVVFPCLEKRVNGAMYAKFGMLDAKNDGDRENTEHPYGDPAGGKSPTPSPKEKKSKEKNNISPPLSPIGTEGRRRGRGGKAAKSEQDKEWDEFFELAIKRAMGKNA